MSLSPGTRLGPYEIVAPLGAGGMGEVYRAHDTKLGRDVAIKILPDLFANDADRLARFNREAQVLASLNHPNIAAIYGVEDSTPVKALVLELVEGETLGEKLRHGSGLMANGSGSMAEASRRSKPSAISHQPSGGLPVDEALNIARQIAEALEAAHEQGIIHRDLKPANVKLRPDGAVKVLDFGLAKALDDGSASLSGEHRGGLTAAPTLSVHATYAGMILGTAAYMSPEQARGKPVDRRSDIWSFGCVLYEMLAGRQAFDAGETVSDTIAAILTREPDLSALPAATPSSIRTLLRRCLQKNPQKRLPHIATARFELEEALAAPVTGVDGPPPAHAPVTSRGITMIIAAAAASAAVAVIAVWALLGPAPQPRPVVRLQAPPPASDPLQISPLVGDIALSSDGTRIAFVAGSLGQLFIRALGERDPKALPGVVNVRGPFFSPDGAWVAYFEGNDLKKVSSDGGPPMTICPSCGAGNRGASWGSDETIVFCSNGGTLLRRVPAAGGEPATIADRRPGDNTNYLWPEILPGGQAVLFSRTTGSEDDRSQVMVRDLKTGTEKILVRGAGQAHYAATGHLVYGMAGTLRAVAFDVGRLETAGNPVPVLDRVITKSSGAADFSLSRDGTLAYISGAVRDAGQTLVWVDRAGAEEPSGAPPRRYSIARVSPDGHRIAVDLRDQDNDIWTWDADRPKLERLTFDPAADQFPVWTPDGKRIVFSSERGGQAGLFWQAADHTGTAERLSHSVNPQFPNAFTADRKTLVFGEVDPKTGADLFTLSMVGDRTAKPLLRTPFFEGNADLSPDSQWIVYQSNESGPDEVYVRPFPAVDTGRWQVSTAGGTRPVWARNGRELFYVDPRSRLMAVAVQTKRTFIAGNPTVVLENVLAPAVGYRTYDVSPDGRRFLVIKETFAADQKTEPPQLNVVLNWGEELKRLVPAKR